MGGRLAFLPGEICVSLRRRYARVPKHKTAEVSRGHSTSAFFFEGRAEHYGTQWYHKIRALVQRQPHRFFRDGTPAGGKDGIWR